MQQMFLFLAISLISWVYYMYSRKQTNNKKVDSIEQFWFQGLDFRILVCAITFTILTLLSIMRYFFNLL